jgi:hypothetical protein
MSEQERRAMLGSGDLVSIAQAAALTPYSSEYLSLLARTGKLPALKLARNWLTTKGAVADYIKTQQHKHQSILHKLSSGKEQL